MRLLGVEAHDVQIVAIADVEGEPARRRPADRRADRCCSRSPSLHAARIAFHGERRTRAPAPAPSRPASRRSRAKQIGAAAADEQHARVCVQRVLRGTPASMILSGRGDVEHEHVARVDVGERQAEHVRVRSGVARLDDQQVAIADACRRAARASGSARVFDVRQQRRRRDARTATASTPEQTTPAIAASAPSSAAARAGDRAPPPPRRSARPAGSPARNRRVHPEVLRHDPNLVEEEQRRTRDSTMRSAGSRQNARAPDEHDTDQRRDQRRRGRR